MKELLLGVVLIILIGVGGLVYRNAVEYPRARIACPVDARICPDGTSVARTGSACAFAECPPPNVSLPDIGITFAVPAGFTAAELRDASSVIAYEKESSTADIASSIVIRRYPIDASSTALATIRETAIGSVSGLPVNPTSFSSTILGGHRFTVVSLERFEAVVTTAYYLARTADVLRFDATDHGVINWMDPDLDSTTLPARRALVELLATLQGE